MTIVPQFDALSVIPSTPGIYAIVNLVNQHFYVGSAKSLSDRKHHHFRDLKSGKHKNSHLQRAYDAYGSDVFLFGILEHVEYVGDLLSREQYYIDTLDPEYNIARVAGSNLGTKTSPETRAKMRAARLANEQMLEQMEKLAADRRGKKLSAEHRATISANQTGRKKTPETVARLSAAHLGKKKTPEHSANIRAAKLGTKHTPEANEKNRAAHLGKKQSPELVEKRVSGLRGKKRPPEVGAKVSATKQAQKLAKLQEN